VIPRNTGWEVEKYAREGQKVHEDSIIKLWVTLGDSVKTFLVLCQFRTKGLEYLVTKSLLVTV
jgi:hypothetical protein